jgi:hypothetical protein
MIIDEITCAPMETDEETAPTSPPDTTSIFPLLWTCADYWRSSAPPYKYKLSTEARYIRIV